MSNLTPTCPNCKCLSDVILKARDGRLVCLNCANAQIAAASASAKIATERAELLQRLANSPAPVSEPEPLPPVEHKLPTDAEPETPWTEPAVEANPTVETPSEESFVAPQPDTKSEKPAKKSDKKKSRY